MEYNQKILITDEISEKAVKSLAEDFEVVIKKDIIAAELEDEIRNYDGLIIKSSTIVTSAVIENSKNLKVIGRPGTNIDNIDLKSATRKGIAVINAPMSNIISAAEFAIALILCLAKKIHLANPATKSGNWDRNKFQGFELEGKTLGIIGFGKIGHQVAKKALCLGLNVFAYDPYVSEDKFWQSGIKKAETIEDIYNVSDIISIHLPRTRETAGLINREELLKMRKGTILINVSRGGIIIEDDLYDALREGQISAAGIDVFENEPCKKSRLFELENVICTPHLGSSTSEAQQKADMIVAQEVSKVLKGEPASSAVNLPSFNEEIYQTVSPFLKLGTDLGSLFSQLFEGNLEELEIGFFGRIAELKTDFLVSVILVEILQKYTDETINIINVNLIAREKGLKIKEVKNPKSQDYVNLITLKGKGAELDLSVSGTVTGIKNIPRFIAVDKFEIDMVPSRYMAFISYKDIPGQIGRIGTAFGKLGVNIAAMHVGRKVVSGEALMGLNLDCEVDEKMLQEFKKLSGFSNIKIINL
ncbi:MAG: phosphoglycerate dehydrogenase [Actinobacteria bacterium]|nr:phosphoglycerate dehydrogenase [Actinomycetota bacterium]